MLAGGSAGYRESRHSARVEKDPSTLTTRALMTIDRPAHLRAKSDDSRFVRRRMRKVLWRAGDSRLPAR